MSCFHDSYTFQLDSRVTFDDLTVSGMESVKKSGIINGLFTVDNQNTTCSVLIKKTPNDDDYRGTQFIFQDSVIGMQKLCPTCDLEDQCLHPGPKHTHIAKQEWNEEAGWSLNTFADLCSTILGRSVTIPIFDREVQSGEFGRIYFAYFYPMRARKPTVRDTIYGD